MAKSGEDFALRVAWFLYIRDSTSERGGERMRRLIFGKKIFCAVPVEGIRCEKKLG